jgi:hypothetical protein
MGQFANQASIVDPSPRVPVKSFFCDWLPYRRPSRLQKLHASLLVHLKMCRAGADVNSGYPGRIRAVVNLSRPHRGSSDYRHSS